MSNVSIVSPSGVYRLELQPEEIYETERGPNPNRREHPVVLFQGQRQVSRVLTYNPWEELAAVTDDGVFMVGDWGPENKTLFGVVFVFDAHGNQLFEESFKANLASTALSPDGRLVLVETLASDHADGSSLFLFDLADSNRLWRRDAPVSPRRWTIKGDQIWAVCDDLGRFPIGLDGAFTGRDDYEHACVTKGKFDQYEPVVRSWLRERRLTEVRIALALAQADRLLTAGFASYRDKATSIRAKALRIKGELEEAKGDSVAALGCYRRALAHDLKVGVKRRVDALEKQLPVDVVASLREETPLRQTRAASRKPLRSTRRRPRTPIRLVAFDLETTGLDAATCDIIEIGGVKFGLDGEMKDTFQAFANPGLQIPSAVVAKTGITDAMVRHARPPWFVVRDFARWVGDGATLVAHNAPYDCKFLKTAYGRAQAELPSWSVVDTLTWARRARLPVRNHQLQTLLKHIKRDTLERHRAVADARGAAELFLFLLSKVKDPGASISRRATLLANVASPPATARQLNYLRDLGAPETTLAGVDRDRASLLIDHYKTQQTPTPPISGRQGCMVAVVFATVLITLGAVAAWQLW